MRNRYEIIETRLFDTNASPVYVNNVVKAMKAVHGYTIFAGVRTPVAGVEVRRFTRAIKAGGAVIPVTVVVVRRDKRKLLVEAVGNGAEATRMDA